MLRLSRRSVLVSSIAGGAAAISRSAFAGAAQPAPASFSLTAADGRSIAISEWRPRTRQRGIILFSHGALSAPHLYERLIGPWTSAGYRVLAPLHVDSAQHPRTAEYKGLVSWKARIEDMRALSAYIGNRPWIAAGHSYGALTALTMGGATAIAPTGISGPLSDAHVRAVIAFSPPTPIPALISPEGYGKIAVPALIQTGTADNPPGMNGTPLLADGWKGHLAAYDAAPAGGNRYGLVLEGVDHYFGGAICRYEVAGPKQLDQLTDALRISDLFLRAFGENNRRAKKTLDSLISDAFPVRLMHK